MTFNIEWLENLREFYAKLANSMKVPLSKSSISLLHAYFSLLLLVIIAVNGFLVEMANQDCFLILTGSRFS